MEKLENGIYRINKNENLINDAVILLKSELPKCYSEKYKSYYETSNLLHDIINDRSNKIDECVMDYTQGKPLDLFYGLDCKIYLDIETEKIIEQLFEREKDILDIKPQKYVIIK